MNIQQIKNKAVPILKKHGVLRSSIFGSFARGEAGGKSDIDILVEFKEPIGLIKFSMLQRKLEEALKRRVDLLTYRSVSPRLKNFIEKEEIPIL